MEINSTKFQTRKEFETPLLTPKNKAIESIHSIINKSTGLSGARKPTLFR